MSRYSEERLAAGDITELLIVNGITNCDISMTAEYEDIQWDSFCAEWIRNHQMWLTSDRRVERIDGEQSLSSIQKRMQNIIEEEVDDHLSSEVSSMLNKCDSILSHSNFSFQQ